VRPSQIERELLYNWVKEMEISLHQLFPQETVGNINKGVQSLECQSSELINSTADKSS
jgi:hypothetical protein